MDTSGRFFAKIRSLAVHLETETANLQHASQNFNDDDEEPEGAVRVLHELHSEVRGLKRQVQDQLARHEAEGNEVRSFIKMCLVLKQRTTEDLERLRMHYEKYGYKSLKTSQKHSEVKGQDVEAANVRPTQEEQVEGAMEEEQGAGEEATPAKMPPPAVDPMRTPQLSDFGLSEFHLQRVLGNPGLSQDIAPLPKVTLSPPWMHPPKPKTPKCVLRMDEDALTPRLEDFGITEHTMCLNNDFTMDLLRKKPSKAASKTVTMGPGAGTLSPPHVLSTPTSTESHSQVSNESMDSPEPPVFCTPGFKITKRRQAESSPPLDGSRDPEPPTIPDTPELPAFETPYISKLLSVRKEVRHGEGEHDVIGSQEGGIRPSDQPTTSKAPGLSGGWSCDIPEMPIRLAPKDEPTPEMPSLQSFLGSSLLCRSAGVDSLPGVKMGTGYLFGLKEPLLPALESQDGHTQEWSLATPRVRAGYPTEPRTPEMPDMSSVTQDIFKLVPRCSSKAPTAVVQPNLKPGFQTVAAGKENRVQSLAPVAEREFLSLAGYLRQIPLSSLNQAIHKVNRAMQERHSGGDADSDRFGMEELKRITGVGPKAPMYILCLVELKRLESMQGVGSSATYRILTHT